MSAVTVSPKFQIVIPADIRKSLRIQPGQKLNVIAIGDQISLVPVEPIKTLRGFLKGIDTSVPREPDRV